MDIDGGGQYGGQYEDEYLPGEYGMPVDETHEATSPPKEQFPSLSAHDAEEGHSRAFYVGLAVAGLVVLAGVLVGVVFLVRHFTSDDSDSDEARHICKTNADCKTAGEVCTDKRCGPPSPPPGQTKTDCEKNPTYCGGSPFCRIGTDNKAFCNCKDSEGRLVSGLDLSKKCVAAPPKDEKVNTEVNAYKEAGGFVDAGNQDAVKRYLGWDEVEGKWSVRQLSAAKSVWNQDDPLPVFQSAPDNDPATKFDKTKARYCVDKLPAKEGDTITVTKCADTEKYCRAGKCAATFADPPPSNSGLGGGAIAGIVVGVLVLLVFGWLMSHKHKRKLPFHNKWLHGLFHQSAQPTPPEKPDAPGAAGGEATS